MTILKVQTVSILNKSLFQTDLVITTANIPGKKAPVLITKEQVLQMKNGAVIIDLAASQGGNCEVSKIKRERDKHDIQSTQETAWNHKEDPLGTI